ncbi:dual specificity testis-specific protein kinase 1-like [Paramacrobiotus metropolitanus]|uniref:dual specificity testis-specific protein kinase 1-like n=1 Tax=Paramacrobiotus metropolitanus TaxID=2943436 RepID=UPI002445B530|nr:dual specificity testis-specific protein kinase 1-like [Paramacrobiotus metropolitanus]
MGNRQNPSSKAAPSTPTTERIGSNCRYRYKNADYIGRGKFGIVYKARITRRGNYSGENFVAVKVIHLHDHTEFMNGGERWEKWHNRLRSLVAFRHDGLLTYHQVRVTRSLTGRVVVELAMDYCDGGDLASLLKILKEQSRFLDYAAAINYIAEIVSGVDFLHQHNIIHGDLKPENILIRRMHSTKPKLVIGDLDELVHMQDHETASCDISHLRGTTRYMAPEILRKFAQTGHDLPGRKTDIWSLGCVMLAIADSVMGVQIRSLRDPFGTTVVEAECRIPESRYVGLIIDGYMPVVPDSVPVELAFCIQQCLRTEITERISADQLFRQVILLQKHLSPQVIMLFHCLDQGDRGSNVRVQVLDPSARTMRDCKLPSLPSSLDTLHFLGIFTANSTQILCHVRANELGHELILWDVPLQTWQWIVPLQPLRAMICPIMIKKKIYFFWKTEHQDLLFSVLNMSDWRMGALPAPSLPDGARVHEVISGARFGHRLVYFSTPSLDSVFMYVTRFDTVTREWVGFRQPLSYRKGFATVVVRGHLYILSGVIPVNAQESSVDSSAEPTNREAPCQKLNMRTGVLEAIPDLKYPRTNHCAFARNSRIFVLGGTIAVCAGDNTTSVTEMYDTERHGQWSLVPFCMLNSQERLSPLSAGIPYKSTNAVSINRLIWLPVADPRN